MEIIADQYKMKFVNNTWQTFIDNKHMATATEDMWNIDEVAFSSRIAGEMLLNGIINIKASFDLEQANPVVVMVENSTPEPGMLKTDDGDVEDIPTPSDKIEGVDPLHLIDPGVGDLSEEKLIIIKMSKVLDLARQAKSNDIDYTSLLREADILKEQYIGLQKQALLAEMKQLTLQAEADLKIGKDCTDIVERIEKIAKFLG